MALNSRTYVDLTENQARTADPALMSDQELAYALDWMVQMRDALSERVDLLSAEHRRRRHAALYGAHHATHHPHG